MIPAGPAPQQQQLEPTQAQMPPQSSSEAGDFDDLIQRKTQSSQQPTTAQLLFGPNRASSRPGGTITAPRPPLPVAARPPAQRPAMPTLGTQKYPRGAKPAVPMPGFPQRRIPSRPSIGATSRPPVIQQRRQPVRRPLRPAPASITNPAAINNAYAWSADCSACARHVQTRLGRAGVSTDYCSRNRDGRRPVEAAAAMRDRVIQRWRAHDNHVSRTRAEEGPPSPAERAGAPRYTTSRRAARPRHCRRGARAQPRRGAAADGDPGAALAEKIRQEKSG